jgi:hypothetical protein
MTFTCMVELCLVFALRGDGLEMECFFLCTTPVQHVVSYVVLTVQLASGTAGDERGLNKAYMLLEMYIYPLSSSRLSSMTV